MQSSDGDLFLDFGGQKVNGFVVASCPLCGVVYFGSNGSLVSSWLIVGPNTENCTHKRRMSLQSANE